MPLATDDEVAEFVRKHGPVRLACDCCSRDDFDGVRVLPGDWQDIRERQSLRDSLSVYDGRPGSTDDDPAPRGYSVLAWWTHLGTCPECSLVQS